MVTCGAPRPIPETIDYTDGKVVNNEHWYNLDSFDNYQFWTLSYFLTNTCTGPKNVDNKLSSK